MSKKTGDISVNTLEELVKTHGDGIVTGYVRFKKIKKCKGYKDAGNKAAVRLSKIKGGRLISENEYAAVIRFRWIILLLLLLLTVLLFFLLKTKIKAKIREEETTGILETIEETITKPEQDDKVFIPETMDIPGFSDITVSSDSKNIVLYNPMNNKCMLGYRIISGSVCIYESGMIMPGEFETADIYNSLNKGVYRIKILTTGYTSDGKELNSVSQSVILKVE